MSGSFVNASGQYILRTGAPLTAPPFTFACWAKPTFSGNGGGNQGAISIGNSSTGFSNYSLGVDGSPEWWVRRDELASNLDELDVSAGIVASTVQFAMGRVVAVNNVWLHVLNADGSISSGQSTSSRNPTGLNAMAIGQLADSFEIGTTTYFDGLLGECWLSNIDVMGPGGGAADAALFRQLAWNGPFSVPRVAISIVEYRPFLQNFLAGQENYYQGTTFPIWTNVGGGPGLAPNMPLLPGYPRPKDLILRGMF